MSSKTTIAVCTGSSYDGRTNKWRITCPKCGDGFVPQTTRLATQHLECPKARCGVSMVALYNEEPPIVRLVD